MSQVTLPHEEKTVTRYKYRKADPSDIDSGATLYVRESYNSKTERQKPEIENVRSVR